MEIITLDVFGMSCGHCVKAIEGSVGALDGVGQVMVSLSDGKARIEYNPSVVELDSIKRTIEELGYHVG